MSLMLSKIEILRWAKSLESASTIVLTRKFRAHPQIDADTKILSVRANVIDHQGKAVGSKVWETSKLSLQLTQDFGNLETISLNTLDGEVVKERSEHYKFNSRNAQTSESSKSAAGDDYAYIHVDTSYFD